MLIFPILSFRWLSSSIRLVDLGGLSTGSGAVVASWIGASPECDVGGGGFGGMEFALDGCREDEEIACGCEGAISDDRG